MLRVGGAQKNGQLLSRLKLFEGGGAPPTNQSTTLLVVSRRAKGCKTLIYIYMCVFVLFIYIYIMTNTYIIYYMLFKKTRSKNWRTVLSKTHPNHVIQHTHLSAASDQQRVAHHNLQNTQNLQQLLSNLTHPCWNAPGFNMSPSIAAEMTLKWDKKQIHGMQFQSQSLSLYLSLAPLSTASNSII